MGNESTKKKNDKVKESNFLSHTSAKFKEETVVLEMVYIRPLLTILQEKKDKLL